MIRTSNFNISLADVGKSFLNIFLIKTGCVHFVYLGTEFILLDALSTAQSIHPSAAHLLCITSKCVTS